MTHCSLQTLSSLGPAVIDRTLMTHWAWSIYWFTWASWSSFLQTTLKALTWSTWPAWPMAPIWYSTPARDGTHLVMASGMNWCVVEVIMNHNHSCLRMMLFMIVTWTPTYLFIMPWHSFWTICFMIKQQFWLQSSKCAYFTVIWTLFVSCSFSLEVTIW